jgi:L-glyceraldehyde 3-phosphate reductase
MGYTASENRYDEMIYKRCGNSGLKLPVVSLGLWHNFGDAATTENMKAMLFKAFNLGITHFDLANNYGPFPGSAEINFGRIFKSDFMPYRDEIIISTKAGYKMWDGPYGEWGSRKNILASLDQSLQRMQLDYVDIFYSHRPDNDTPLEETMGALATAVSQGKALYASISNYSPEMTKRAYEILKSQNTPFVISQNRYNIFSRAPEEGIIETANEIGLGLIIFSPLSQGLLTDKYLGGIPEDSRAAGKSVFLKTDQITPELLEKVAALNEIAKQRNQSLAQMALAWVLRHNCITSVLIGASHPEQIEENAKMVNNLNFSEEELSLIDKIAPIQS